ncbi:MAG: hypothetical protein ACTSSH_14495 [Candidatus Heimdallarchaeota archaeon]
MKIGMTVEPFKGISYKKIVFLLKVVGLDHLEINMTTIPQVDDFVKNLGKFTTTFHLPI